MPVRFLQASLPVIFYTASSFADRTRSFGFSIGQVIIAASSSTLQGNRWIILAVDFATGWTVAQAVPEAGAEVVGNFIYEKIYAEYGPPHTITSDNNDPQFASDVLAFTIQGAKAKHHLHSPYHPQRNGKVERLNGLLRI
jgi:hypothetical protein